MKTFNLFIFLVFVGIILIHCQLDGQTRNKTIEKKMNLKGILSGDDENDNEEADPSFIPANYTQALLEFRGAVNSIPVKDHPNGLELITETVKEMIKTEINFALIPQHKYMINNCLGLKVSVGEFKMKLENPYVAIYNNGIIIRFTIDKISLNALTIRMRPCYNDAQCHFSPRFDIGGTASNITLEIKCNLTIDMDLCKISFTGLPSYKWKIGGLNLKPLQNNLDKVAKNMLEDALNVASMQLIPIAFNESSGIALYSSSLCQTSDLARNQTTLNKVSGKVETEEKTEEERWELISNKRLTGPTGRIIINPPGKAVYEVTVFKAGTDEVTQKGYVLKEIRLLPGEYDVRIASNNSVYRIKNVNVNRGADTRIYMGTLNISLPGTNWKIFDEMKELWVEQGYSNRMVGLPVGKYFIQVGNDFIEVEIRDGLITEL